MILTDEVASLGSRLGSLQHRGASLLLDMCLRLAVIFGQKEAPEGLSA